jgi:hypothetical protein
VALYLRSPNTPSWRGAQLKAQGLYECILLPAVYYTVYESLGQETGEDLTSAESQVLNHNMSLFLALKNSIPQHLFCIVSIFQKDFSAPLTFTAEWLAQLRDLDTDESVLAVSH